jgi:hypothetical protein
MMLNAQIDRSYRSASPYLTSRGLTKEEIQFLSRANTYTARGHHIFVALATTTLSDVIDGSFAAQSALVRELLRRHDAA